MGCCPDIRTCCCGCKLKTGTLVISVMTALFSGVWIAYHSRDIYAYSNDPKEESENLVVVLATVVAVACLWLFSALLLRFAVIVKSRCCMIPWIISTMMVIVVNLIGLGYHVLLIIDPQESSKSKTNVFIVRITWAGVVVIIFSYFLAIVMSYYRHNLHEPGERRPGIEELIASGKATSRDSLERPPRTWTRSISDGSATSQSALRPLNPRTCSASSHLDDSDW